LASLRLCASFHLAGRNENHPQILKKKDFVLDRVKGSHHIYIHPETRRRKDLPKGTLLSILQQAGIDRDELTKLL